MELLQVLEPEDKPQESTWYALVPAGEGPGERVGHTCTYIPGKDGHKGKILIVGGANPNGSFSDSYIIDLEAGSWRSVKVCGTPPSARTYHTCSACIGDRLYVFSGGDQGAAPVSDSQLHVFDSASLTWSQPQTQGKPPSPRHGHVIVSVGSKLYIHGGLAGEALHSDLHCIDTTDMRWERVRAKGDVPPGCAAHSAAALGKVIYIFGGMTAAGAVNSMYKFHIDRQRWTLVTFGGALPSKRLDHSMCVVPWRLRASGDVSRALADTGGGGDKDDPAESLPRRQQEENSSLSSPGEFVHLCFVFGGMDTEGNIYKDCAVAVLSQ
ncbi:rab9 effector protein with kelch motifs isoform X2 [Lepisosteus oculatus]|uniref:rab9 effector protein with kelch motifs isoform X2 n=1 Tax=Lepisosteus oculatus TaxID=7918 RepID=UPI003715E426